MFMSSTSAFRSASMAAARVIPNFRFAAIESLRCEVCCAWCQVSSSRAPARSGLGGLPRCGRRDERDGGRDCERPNGSPTCCHNSLLPHRPSSQPHTSCQAAPAHAETPTSTSRVNSNRRCIPRSHRWPSLRTNSQPLRTPSQLGALVAARIDARQANQSAPTPVVGNACCSSGRMSQRTERSSSRISSTRARMPSADFWRC